jgi:hypothetical protein
MNFVVRVLETGAVFMAANATCIRSWGRNRRWKVAKTASTKHRKVSCGSRYCENVQGNKAHDKRPPNRITNGMSPCTPVGPPPNLGRVPQGTVAGYGARGDGMGGRVSLLVMRDRRQVGTPVAGSRTDGLQAGVGAGHGALLLRCCIGYEKGTVTRLPTYLFQQCNGGGRENGGWLAGWFAG